MDFGLKLLLLSLGVFLVAYAYGSLNVAIIVTYITRGVDIRKSGSGNAGLTNVLRTAGKGPALATLLFDFLKGFSAALLGRFLFFWIVPLLGGASVNPVYGAYIAALGCFLGHIFPVYYGFQGGKGVLSLVSVMLAIDWKTALICLGLFIAVLLVTKIVSISSILAVGSFPFLKTLYSYRFTADNTYDHQLFGIGLRWFEGGMALLVAGIVLFKHRANMGRLIRGEESKLTFKNRS